MGSNGRVACDECRNQDHDSLTAHPGRPKRKQLTAFLALASALGNVLLPGYVLAAGNAEPAGTLKDDRSLVPDVSGDEQARLDKEKTPSTRRLEPTRDVPRAGRSSLP